MGTMSDLEIETWQKNAGIEPATGQRLEAWRRLQKVCFETIRIAELEVSGIRDGDGHWHGSDVVGHLLDDLGRAVACLDNAHHQPVPTPRFASIDEIPF